jgi:hypothetical protein
MGDLSRKERLKLIQTLNQLPPTQFEELAFALDPPAGLVPSMMAAQGTRAPELLRWVEGVTGPGLSELLELLDLLLGKSDDAGHTQSIHARTSPLKPGAPFPRVRLPDNFVARPEALNAVKAKLIAETDQTLVVSAISGLGGLGKSVLATALVLDEEVQARFADGILWVTLGQNPDVQTMLGDWIRELDKSREAFSANTLEAASRYQDTLLAEKRMLLLVDDVWNAAHADWFRVGGAGCRVLITTREAQVDGADYYSLDLMSEESAIDLVRQKLKNQWHAEQEAEVKTFAKSLGYLPLALDLAANQVKEGLTWAELRNEFETERRSVALEVLDSSEAWDALDEEQQRKYSLRACFSLSLRRLNPTQLKQFAWLGVLPEDVNLTAQVAAVLWDVRPLLAKKTLIDLRRRSLLTDGVRTVEGEAIYRVHDLMHDTALSLIEDGKLQNQTSEARSQNLQLAHCQFLERYREQATDHQWDQLPNDGYSHRHLMWHLEQSGQTDEIHLLMARSDDSGRNAWFEACERIGQPAVFVESVSTAWRVAELAYDAHPTQSIILQCRYALITATLNSLISSLPIGVMVEFVKRDFWTVEQAWVYVEQMQDEYQISEAIQKLAPYFPNYFFDVVIAKTRAIQDEGNRASVLSALAQQDGAYFNEALEAARKIQDEDSRAEVLSALAQQEGVDFNELLKAVRAIQDEDSRAEVLSALAQQEDADFNDLLEAARAIKDEYSQAEVLSALAQQEGADFHALLEAARALWDKTSQAKVLSALAQQDAAYFNEALEAARAIQDEFMRARVLSALAQQEGADFNVLLEAARALWDKTSRAEVLSALAQQKGAYFNEALEVARTIQDEFMRASVLSALAQQEEADFNALLEAACTIQDEDSRAKVLSALAQQEGTDFNALLEAACTIQDEDSRAKVLSALAQQESAYFNEALEVARTIQDEFMRASVLSALAQQEGADFNQLLEATRAIQDEDSRAEVLSALAQQDAAYFNEALEESRAIQSAYSRVEVLSALAQQESVDFNALLETVRAIQSETSRAEVLSALAQQESADFNALLEAARAIQSEYSRARVLSALAQQEGAYFNEALEAARAIQSEFSRARVLSALAQHSPSNFLIEIWNELYCFSNKSIAAQVLSSALKRVPLETLPYTRNKPPDNKMFDWKQVLRLLSFRKRSDFMNDLCTLYPAIVHLGGEGAMRGVVDAMREVCRQWP